MKMSERYVTSIKYGHLIGLNGEGAENV